MRFFWMMILACAALPAHSQNFPSKQPSNPLWNDKILNATPRISDATSVRRLLEF